VKPEPEALAPGGQWLGNAQVYEDNRRVAVDDMHRAEEAGLAERVAELRERVEFYRRLRDDDQRRMQERAFFRTFNSRRRY
jgi:hypothetical protein